MMYTFKQFLEQQMLSEAGPAPTPMPAGGGGGLGTPGSLPPGGPAPSGSMPMPPMGGGVPPPPMGGGLGGLGGGLGPPMGGAAPGGTPPNQGADKLKAYNIWDVLERVLNIQK